MDIQKIESIINSKYWTNYLGLGRSLLALGTLLTLLFNQDDVLMFNSIDSPLNEVSIFKIFDNILISRILSYIILILVIIGVFPRFTAIFHWWISFSFFYTSGMVEGGDQITSIITLLLIPILLLDKRKNHWYIDENHHSYYEKVTAFCFYFLIIIQVSILYFTASIGKLKVDEWANGTAVYYWFNDSVFGLNYTFLKYVNPLLKSPILISIITWGAIGVELFLSLMIFGLRNKKMVRIAFIVGVLLHFSFALCFGLIGFFLAMCGVLLLYLVAINENFNLKKPSTI